MSNKNKTAQNQTQNYSNQASTQWGYMTPPDTPDIRRLRETEAEVDPTIGYRIGSSVRRMRDQFANPLGGYATPAMRDAIMRGQERELMQEGGAQFRSGQYDANRQNYGRNLAVAGMTAPQLVQQGSTSSGTGNLQGTTTQSTSPWGAIGSAAAAPLAAASL